MRLLFVGFAMLMIAADPIGTRIDNLGFTDIRGLPRTLDDFGKPKAVVIVYLDTSCPVAQRYLPTLQSLHEAYAKKGVQLLALNAAPDDSLAAIATQAVVYKAEFPFGKDFDGVTAKKLGIDRTPQAIVLNADRHLVYRGRIDDQFRLGGNREKPSANELKEAIEAVLAGQPIAISETRVDGCPITFPKAREPNKVTYAEHVAPLLNKHCSECHRTGGMGPFSLTSFHQAASRGESLGEVVKQQRMPPWYATDEYGPFVNKRGLNASERQVIADWLALGAPRGDETKEPPPMKVSESPWIIGEPDRVLETVTIDLPAKGDIAYQYALLPHLFTDDTWVSGVQITTTHPRNLHHANLAFGGVLEGFNEANFITGQVPGGEPMNLDEGTAFKIPKGMFLGLQMHFVSTGKPEKVKVRVGLRYPRGVVRKQLHSYQFTDRRFAIPPGATHHAVKSKWTLPEDVTGVGLFAHMHLRGKAMTFHAGNDPLLVVGNYNFGWQLPYRWEPGTKHLKKGTAMECVAVFDNSPFNPYNPDATKTVRNGPQTHHEMMVGFFFYTKTNETLQMTIDQKTGAVSRK